jgi:hypothetical protein
MIRLLGLSGEHGSRTNTWQLIDSVGFSNAPRTMYKLEKFRIT